MSARLRLVTSSRPKPPQIPADGFAPADELQAWAYRTFIDDGGPLTNPEHAHLQAARIGFLWTTAPNSRAGRVILGQAELMPPMVMGKWQKARALWQIEGWFGYVPDFLITVSAGYALTCDDASFCALIEHELYHCTQAVDVYGVPRFRKSDGSPIFEIRGHDVEEFVGVVERYGADAAGVAGMVEAAKRGPSVAPASIAQACGTCLRRAA